MLGIEYPGAIYHVMGRGDRRENIFRDKADPERLLGSLRWVTPRGRRPNPVVYKMQADAERLPVSGASQGKRWRVSRARLG